MEWNERMGHGGEIICLEGNIYIDVIPNARKTSEIGTKLGCWGRAIEMHGWIRD